MIHVAELAVLWMWGQLANRPGWYIDREWIPAYAESTPQRRPSERPSHGNKVLGGIEEHLRNTPRLGQKGSGVLKNTSETPLALDKRARGY